MNVATDISGYAPTNTSISQSAGKQVVRNKDDSDNVGSFGGIFGDQMMQQSDLSRPVTPLVAGDSAGSGVAEHSTMKAFPAFSESAAGASPEALSNGQTLTIVESSPGMLATLIEIPSVSATSNATTATPPPLPGQLVSINLATTAGLPSSGKVPVLGAGAKQEPGSNTASMKGLKPTQGIAKSPFNKLSPASHPALAEAGGMLSDPLHSTIGTAGDDVLCAGSTADLAKAPNSVAPQVSDTAATQIAAPSIMLSQTTGKGRASLASLPSALESMQTKGQTLAVNQTQLSGRTLAQGAPLVGESPLGTSMTASASSSDAQLQPSATDQSQDLPASLAATPALGESNFAERGTWLSSAPAPADPNTSKVAALAQSALDHEPFSRDARKLSQTDVATHGAEADKTSLDHGNSILSPRDVGANAAPVSGGIAERDGVHFAHPQVASSSADKNFFSQMDSPIVGSARGASAGLGSSTLLHATSREIDVGVHDPVYGWVEVKAQMVSGQVSASLSATTTTANHALEAQLPAMSNFLTQREVNVASLDVMAHAGSSQGGTSNGTREQGGDGGREQASQSQPGATGSRSSSFDSVKEDLQQWLFTSGQSSGIRVVA